MLRRSWMSLVIGFGLITVSPGCRGGDGSDGSKFPSDLLSDQTIGEIGVRHLDRLCTTFESWLYDQYAESTILQAACTYLAVQSTSDATACAQSLQECIDDPSVAQPFVDQILAQARCVAVTEYSECSTVGQLEACLDALGDEIDRIEFTLTCAAAGQPVDSSWWQIAEVEACSIEAFSCPEVPAG